MPAALKVACVVIVCLGTSLFALPGGAQASRTLVVAPDSDLVSGDLITVSGSGISSGALGVGVCELVIDADPGREDCGFVGGPFGVDASGEFSGQFEVRRYLETPSAGFVDCAAPSATCGIGVAEVDSALDPIPGTQVVVPISLREFAASGRPDIIIKNRATGAFSGDNFTTTICCNQYRQHVAVGGRWSYALRVQNDDVVVDDLLVTAPPDPRVRYFFSYFEITAQVTSGGFRYTAVGPGEILPLSMQMSGAGLPPGDIYAVPVTVASGAVPTERIDVAWLAVEGVQP